MALGKRTLSVVAWPDRAAEAPRPPASRSLILETDPSVVATRVTMRQDGDGSPLSVEAVGANVRLAAQPLRPAPASLQPRGCRWGQPGSMGLPGQFAGATG